MSLNIVFEVQYLNAAHDYYLSHEEQDILH